MVVSFSDYLVNIYGKLIFNVCKLYVGLGFFVEGIVFFYCLGGGVEDFWDYMVFRGNGRG